jgi:hypothetical protein
VSLEKQSGTMLAASPIAPQDLFTPLPEDVLEYLHGRLDRDNTQSLPEHTLDLHRFETAIIERLFPHQDQRRVLVRLRLHSRVTAIAAAVIASQTNVPVQTAFACGWLHDMGIASCIHHLDDRAIVYDTDQLDRSWKIILHSVPRHTVYQSSRLRLPSNLRFALRDHVGFDSTATPSSLACVIFIAEHLAALQGCGFRDEQPASGLRPRLVALGLTERDLLPLARRTEQRICHLELAWQSLRLFEGA